MTARQPDDTHYDPVARASSIELSDVPLKVPRASAASSFASQDTQYTSVHVTDDETRELAEERAKARAEHAIGPGERSTFIKGGHRDRWHLRWSSAYIWSTEIFGSAFSLILIVVMIAVLVSIDGKPYEQWKVANVHITPNTLVAILSTIAKASFLVAIAEGISQLKWTYFQERRHPLVDLDTFDRASRGPLGAFKLLCTVHVRAGLASVGALLTILALATDPFTQQILSYQSVSTNVTNVTASIGTTKIFDGGYHDLVDDGFVEKGYDAFVNSNNNAMFRGMFAPELQVSFSCSSGDCQWPTFETLGMCSTCAAQQATIINCTSYTFPVHTNLTQEATPFCLYNTTSGMVTNVTWSLTDKQAMPYTWYQSGVDLPLASSGGQEPGSYNLWTGTQGQFANLTSVRFLEHYDWSNSMTLRDASLMPSVYQCTMYWCEKTFANSSVVSGTLLDVPTFIRGLTINPRECGAPHGAAGTGPGANETVGCPASPLPDIGTPYLGGNPDWEGLSLGQDEEQATESKRSVPEEKAPYWIDQGFAANMQTGFSSIFAVYLGMSTGGGQSPAISQWLYNANDGNTSKTLESVANSITNQMRGAANSTQVPGRALLPLVFVSVQWRWLAYPAGLAVFALAFLICSIIASNSRSSLIWKSSSLALLYHQLDDWDEREAYIRDIRAMERQARGMQVRLVQDYNGRISFAP